MRMSRLVVFVQGLLLVHSLALPSKPLPAADTELIARYRLALDAIFGMGIRLQAFLQKEDNENFLVSPIGATLIVGQLLLGADGELQEQLVELLSLPDSQRYKNDKMNFYGKNKNESYSLPYSTLHLQLSGLLRALENSATSKKHFILKENSVFFYDKAVRLRDDFERNLKNIYMVRPRQVDFAGKPVHTLKLINNWAAKNTNGLITTILPHPPSSDTASILANAVYFLAEWEIPFSDELNRPGRFNVTSTKQVPVTYMIGFLEQIFYAESPEYRVIALPYKDEELGMYLLLPGPESKYKYDMKNFALDMNASEILDTLSKGKRRDVVVKLPKMALSASFSILDQLEKYRVFKRQKPETNSTKDDDNALDKLEVAVRSFNNFTAGVGADVCLKRATVGECLRVSDIVQQVVINVNEKGTEAAAVSASTIDYIGGSKNFLVERPFLFFIRHEATSATLFWGTVSNPAA